MTIRTGSLPPGGKGQEFTPKELKQLEETFEEIKDEALASMAIAESGGFPTPHIEQRWISTALRKLVYGGRRGYRDYLLIDRR